MKILVLGGYGVFGGRMAELLCDIPDLEIMISGRNLEKATAFCNAYSGQTKVTPLAFDRNDLAQHIGALAPDIVVDASGPFQSYDASAVSVIQTCIDARVHYIDFADAADFVFDVSNFNEAAKAANIFVLSGASSFPVLTAAVLREMAKEMDIISVHGGIAPSPYAGVGLNVMRAVVGYAGAPVKIFRNGQQTTASGLAESKRYTISPPGYLPLRNIHFSLVDVPDLQVIPPEHETLQDIWMGAGPIPEVLHRILNLLALGRAKFKLPSLVPLSGLFYFVLNLMKFGEHRGGMFVHATGIKNGQPAEMSWHLLAEGDDGPYIPSMVVEALVRKFHAGDLPKTGARAATRALELSDYAQLFSGKTIYMGFRKTPDPTLPLYRRILGDAFDMLPAPVQSLHELKGKQTWRGQAEVTRGTNPIARLVAKIIGFPPAAKDVDVTVILTEENGVERWQRTFGAAHFESTQFEGKGRNAHLMIEKFGPISIALALVIKNNQLYLQPRSWKFLGVPLPKSLLPSGTTFESAENGKFNFNVTIGAPLIGLIVGYKGSLSPHE